MRKLAPLVLSLLVMLGLSGAARAQDATPASGDLSASSLGVNELNVTVTDTSYEGLPSELAAGFYLVTLTNSSSELAMTTFMELPDGVTVDQILSLGGGSATPETGGATPANGNEMGIPDWYFTTHMAGGPSAQQGGTGQAIVYLQTGQWIFWGDDPSAPQRPVEITVTGDANATPATMTAPNADLTISEVAVPDGYAFKLEGALKPGKQLIQVINQSDQPHFVFMINSPEAISRDQVMALIESDMSGTPVSDPNMPNPANFVEVGGMGTMSSGATAWMIVDVPEGSLILACFVPDPARNYTPHAAEGMYEVVNVTAGGATPESTPNG